MEIADRMEENTKTEKPKVRTLFRPNISASLPKGTRNTAAESRYAVATHPINTAFIENSFPIEGSATFIEEPSQGVINAEIVVITCVTLLLAGSLDKSSVFFGINKFKNPAAKLA